MRCAGAYPLSFIADVGRKDLEEPLLCGIVDFFYREFLYFQPNSSRFTPGHLSMNLSPITNTHTFNQDLSMHG
jgi:hypothetical protein